MGCPSSFANFDLVKVTHYAFDWDVSFERKVLGGSVTTTLVTQAEGVSEAILDTRDLSVSGAFDDADGSALDFSLGERDEKFGTALRVKLPAAAAAKGATVRVRVAYETSPAASAIDWLAPAQTAGKVHPYLYTQCQAIHARSLAPCQDTPAVKITYEAKVRVPAALTALMSALSLESRAAGEGVREFSFAQKCGMPSYLIALAVGDLEKRDLGPRSCVWSEPSMVEAGAFEFSETEQYLATAERLCGPYEWGRYDVLLLPPSFPYGGMENPCLTFVTPTLLAGDRSLANVVAHEIAHSWMGNLVTTKSWEHFWLNEGFTVYVERKILGAIFSEAHRHFAAIVGWKALTDSVEQFGADNPLTALTPSLTGVDPDDSFSSVPYEKGFNLLFYLEGLVGGPAAFEPYLKAHVQKFAHTSITTQEWKAFFLQFFGDEAKRGVFDAVDWDAWFTAPGMPPVTPQFDTQLAAPCEALARRWQEADAAGAGSAFAATDLAVLDSKQRVVFLEKLLLQPDLMSADKVAAMHAAYPELGTTNNSEIRFRWISLGVKAAWEPAYAEAVAMATTQGRMKFVRPLYRDLFKASPDLAVATFQKHRASYHNICSKMVASDLKL